MADPKKKKIVKTSKDIDPMNMVRRMVSPKSVAGKMLERKKKMEKAGR